MPRRPLIVVLAALVVTGCGVGAGGSAQDTQLLITEDFGAQRVEALRPPVSEGEDTQLRMLQRNAAVETKGGGFVQAIGPTAGGREDGRPVDWFLYVNGVAAEAGAASVELRDGDAVWWDHHDWGVTTSVPAVVGQFPQPFDAGVDGERLPLRLECADARSRACDLVSERFAAAGITAGKGRLGGSMAQDTIRVLVGPWVALRGDEAARSLEGGPKASGVYARIAPDGRSITPLDARGTAADPLRAGTGLVAATRFEDSRPIWIITGTDAAGIEAAAASMTRGALDGKFAATVTGRTAVGLPRR